MLSELRSFLGVDEGDLHLVAFVYTGTEKMKDPWIGQKFYFKFQISLGMRDDLIDLLISSRDESTMKRDNL